MTSVIELLRLLRLLYRQRVTGFPVAEKPIFDEESVGFFVEKLRQSNVYLEYGSGGSTMAAAASGKPFLTVESDKYFLSSVKKQAALKFPNSPGVFLHGDLGPTKQWGYPFFQKKTPERLNKWLKYAEGPWDYIRENNLAAPDLVLIDGRLRVCCALVSIRRLPRGSNCTLLVDDYEERPYYRTIEKYAQLTAMQGRMAVFKLDGGAQNTADLDKAINKARADLT